MRMSETIVKLAKSLVLFHAGITNPSKGSVNPHFKSSYAALPDIITHVRAPLAKEGLAVVQSTLDLDGRSGVVTLLLHESGEYIESDPVLLKTRKDDAQGAGSAISYARRYSLLAMLNLAGEEDDDGNAAVEDGGSGTETEAAAEARRKRSAGHLAVYAKRIEETRGSPRANLLLDTIKKELARIKGELLDAHLRTLGELFTELHREANPDKENSK